MWSDGATPQASNPNVFYTCQTDFNTNDYTHPSIPTGAAKVANLLLSFFQNDSLSCSWFFNSSPASCSVTGINEITSTANPVQVYPNPFSSSTTIMIDKNLFAAEKQLSFYLYDVLGNVVSKTEPVSTADLSFNKNDLTNGIYFWKVFSGKGNEISKGKLVIQ